MLWGCFSSVGTEKTDGAMPGSSLKKAVKGCKRLHFENFTFRETVK